MELAGVWVTVLADDARLVPVAVLCHSQLGRSSAVRGHPCFGGWICILPTTPIFASAPSEVERGLSCSHAERLFFAAGLFATFWRKYMHRNLWAPPLNRYRSPSLVQLFPTVLYLDDV